MRFLPSLILCCALLPVAANACMMSEAEKAKLFHTFDTDKDGTLTLEEYMKGEETRVGKTFGLTIRKGFTARYRDMETSGSGKVTEMDFSPVSLQKCM